MVQIPPATSPVLLPRTSRTDSDLARSTRTDSQHVDDDYEDGDGDFETEANYRNSDLVDADDLEFVAPGQWDGGASHQLGGSADPYGYADDDDDDVPDFDIMDDGDFDVEDWTLEDGHIDGVPSCNVRLDAK